MQVEVQGGAAGEDVEQGAVGGRQVVVAAGGDAEAAVAGQTLLEVRAGRRGQRLGWWQGSEEAEGGERA